MAHASMGGLFNNALKLVQSSARLPVAMTSENHDVVAEATRRQTSVDNPYIITNPILGFVNVLGEAGNDLLARDRTEIGSVFSNRVNVAGPGQVPRCNVLFLYCNLDTSARIAGTTVPLRQAVKIAGAHIAVVASEVSVSMLTDRAFGQAIGVKNDWPANIVITGNRNGEHFGPFFREMFSKMMSGVTMPMAWVALAPQGGQQSKNIPGTIALMEAGHIAFGPKKSG